MGGNYPRLEQRSQATFRVLDEGDLYTLREMYEMNVYGIRADEVGPNKKVLDIGANIGVFSVWAALQGASVSAFEPDPRTLPTLTENIGRNGVNHLVSICPEGVMGVSGVLDFFSTEQSAHSTFYQEMVDQRATKMSLSVRGFDEVLGDDIWDVVKIDAEGAEYDMLLASNKLDQIKHLCFEWHPKAGGARFTALCDKLKTTFDVAFNPDWWVMSIYKN